MSKEREQPKNEQNMKALTKQNSKYMYLLSLSLEALISYQQATQTHLYR